MRPNYTVASQVRFGDVRLNPWQQTNPPYLPFQQNYADDFHNLPFSGIGGKKPMQKRAHKFFSQRVYRTIPLSTLHKFFFLTDARMFDLE
jgi:hypothetical protein